MKHKVLAFDKDITCETRPGRSIDTSVTDAGFAEKAAVEADRDLELLRPLGAAAVAGHARGLLPFPPTGRGRNQR